MTIRMIGASIVCVMVGLFISASAGQADTDGVVALADPRPGAAVLAGAEPDSILVSREFYSRSDEAILLGPGALDEPGTRQRVAAAAGENHVPVLTVRPDTAHSVDEELRRLGVQRVVRVGEIDGFDDRRSTISLEDLRGNPRPSTDEPIVMVARGTPMDATLTARSAGRVVEVPVPDPRADGDAVAAVSGASPTTAIRAVGSGFGDDAVFATRVDQARRTPELPGGGQIVFPGRRMVALYGSPDAPALGPLGRQGIEASIDRVRRLAADYQRVSAEPVIPAFEIIATVASSEPGEGSRYTNMLDPAVLRPWVEAAGRAGVYVTLDLQPGRMDFLEQARRYADLLALPHVGLALDPEWRLKPDQVHLTQIGSVEADEVNRTSEWLAGLVRDRGLPQKLFVLHQFDAGMLAQRKNVRTDRPELQVVLHADGHGTPPVKMETWRRLLDDLPAGVWMGWKNFYTEDKPTFSPATTMAVAPTPWFVSYQ
ncbi:hypothetical protein GONAM_15_00760 [Gordonia namibiensis NBRC 108229]|uniref:Uncharacterized protein n=1 Tax=Gordonia namibiensis NBRC 108229 TaxID=1208314 RepID=K6VVY7_9ACTN|nr:hypothetical protein [Gordonia namibiensis]GAC00369.1 hypothetical protein GONAM_15_00760 [Gordonia namibiensis NBRC 108229]